MQREIISSDGSVIIDTLLDSQCAQCIIAKHNNGYSFISCPIDSKRKRIGYYQNPSGKILACDATAKTTKLFKQEFDATVYCLRHLIKLSEDIKQITVKETAARVNRVIHNLKSINAHAMQELYALVPQEQLLKNVRENSKIVENAIKHDVRKAAMTFFRMTRFNLSIKAEFSIYEKLLQGDVKLEKRDCKIRDVIMIVLYMFFSDFNENGVYVDVEEYYEKVYVDFESLQVAIYHLIENATKYIEPNTTAYIKFKIDRGVQYVVFEMNSLYIHPDEESDIFNEGYSGILAKQLKKAGKGIGMYRAKRLIELNEGTLTIEAGELLNNKRYAKNKFIIELPRSK